MAGYFPILDPQDGERFATDWPFTETQYERRYSQRVSHGFQLRRWGAKFQLHNPWTMGNLRTWSAGAAKIIGDYVKPNPPNGYVYMARQAGTTGGTQPSSTTAEAETVDGSVRWITWPDNQIKAVRDFINTRKGHVVNFSLWIPNDSWTLADGVWTPTGAWVTALIPIDPPEFAPVQGGAYGVYEAEILFEESY